MKWHFKSPTGQSLRIRYRCALCKSVDNPFEDSSEENLSDHLKNYHHLINEPHNCPLCLLPVPHLLDHILRDHTGVSEQNDVGKKMSLQSGMAKASIRTELFHCDICRKDVTTKTSLERHRSSIHGIGVPLHCAICHCYVNYRKDRMREHLIIKHCLQHCECCPIENCGLVTKNVVHHIIASHCSK